MKTVVFLTTLFFCILISTNGALAAITFTLSNPQVNNQDITFSASLSDIASQSCPSGKCYFQGMITKKGKSYYFGFTKNNAGELKGYLSSPDPNFITSNFLYCEPVNNSCEISVAMHFNHNDPDYEGPGEYEVKMKRYTGESSNGIFADNELVVSLSVATPTPSATPSPSPSPTASPSPTPTPTKSPSPSPTPTPTKKVSASMGGGTTPTPTSKATATPQGTPTEEQIASLGDATSPPKILGTADSEGGGNQSTRPIIALFMIGGGIAFVGIAGVSFLRTRYNQSTQIPS